MKRHALLALLVLALVGNVVRGQAVEFEDEPQGPRSTFGQQLEQFRKNLLGKGGAPKSAPNHSASTKALGNTAPRTSSSPQDTDTDSPRMATRPTTGNSGMTLGRRLFSPVSEDDGEVEVPLEARRQQPAAQRADTPRTAPSNNSNNTAQRTGSPTPAATASATARRSADADEEPSVPSPKVAATRGTPTMARPKPTANEDDADAPAPRVAALPTRTGDSSRRSPTPANSPKPATEPTPAEETALADEPKPTKQPTVASSRTVPTVMPRVARSDRPLTPTIESSRSQEPTVSRLDKGASHSNHGVLIARSSPNLGVETSGPRRIMVGKEAVYTVSMKNSGDSAAQDVVVYLGIPEWAEVTEARATSGAARNGAPGEGLQWNIGTLAGGGEHQLALKIIPHKSQPFDLGIRWACSPVSTQTTVEVQEPKLQMGISGPSEVLYGQRQLYKLSISNPGTGDAEGVTIHLIPVTPGDGTAASHRMGTLMAGESKSVEIELTARQAGKLTIKAEATADGGLKSSAVEEVLVRRAALQVAVNSPKIHYAGATAQVEVLVRNPGDAPAKNVTVSAVLPSGAELVTAGQGGQADGKRGEINWTLEQIPAGGEQTLIAQCVLRHQGSSRLEVSATADGDLKDTCVANTQVLALADLVLEVSNAPGPVPVGQETTYEIRIRNRGTGAAEHIEVVAFFSEGIEPCGVEGAAADLSAGTAMFKPLDTLSPGRDMVLKVKAKAEQSGTHCIRVELECKTLGAKLTQEHTKLFYGDEPAAPAMLRPTPQ